MRKIKKEQLKDCDAVYITTLEGKTIVMGSIVHGEHVGFLQKQVLDEVEVMVKECIKKDLATDFILLQGLPKIKLLINKRLKK